MVAFANSGATTDSVGHRREATVLLVRLAETLESGMQARFRERWSDVLDLRRGDDGFQTTQL
jgi:hypothetical protein